MPMPGDRLRARLAQDLQAAMKSREALRIAALRSLAAALDNASAVPLDRPGGPTRRTAGEVPRKVLSDDDVREVLAREIGERRDAAIALEKHGCLEEAALIRSEIEIIAEYAAEAAAEGPP